MRRDALDWTAEAGCLHASEFAQLVKMFAVISAQRFHCGKEAALVTVRQRGCSMMFASVVILQPEVRMAQELSSNLVPHFDSVHVARTLQEFRDKVIRNRPRVVVLDIEGAQAEDVRELRHDFPGVPIVCTHRLPDDEMWARVLDAGASDVCPTYDLAAVIGSVLRSAEDSSGAAA